MEILNPNTFTFVAPSGTEYTIREQNGQDEEVLTNVAEINRGMNITNFLHGIIMSSSRKSGKLTLQEVMNLPILDRQCIILQSRIFSLGETMEFHHRWPIEDDPEKFEEFEYTQDLREYLLSDYLNLENITPEELAEKPHAIPAYVQEPFQPFEFTLKSGKHIRFKVSDGNTELYILKLRENDRSRNSDLIARGLELEVEGKWEKVFNFTLFSARDMAEIRKIIKTYDPISNLTTVIENPNTGEHIEVPLLAMATFFFLEEDV